MGCAGTSLRQDRMSVQGRPAAVVCTPVRCQWLWPYGTMRGMTEVYNQPAPATSDAPGPLSGSARGWHTIQMAVLGFIGICGVLRATDSSVPAGVQWAAAFLAAVALVLAGTGVYLVGRVAYPFEAAGLSSPAALARASARLRAGIRLTVLALVLVVIAALSGWWPRTGAPGGASATVTVSDRDGRTWCGRLVRGDTGIVAVDTSRGLIGVPVEAVADVRPVASCG